jgi:acetyltransferase-like isoleucine patch superfamily enzyme
MTAYRALGVRIGAQSTLLMSTEMQHCTDLTIGRNTIINPHCLLDGRGGLLIGDNVNISSHVLLVAGTHDIQNGEEFAGSAEQIVIEDYAWLCTRATILAGVPARKIGERSPDLHYTLVYDVSWC